MCDTLTVTFSNLATNDQAIVNPPASFRSAVWKYYGFLAKDVQQTILKLSAKFDQQRSSMSAHLKRQHSIDKKAEVLDSKTVKIHRVL